MVHGKALARVASAIILTLTIAAAGCGDGGEETGTGVSAARFSAAVEPADVFAKRMARLLATTDGPDDCANLEAINGRSFARFPCPPDRELAASMKSFRVVNHEEHGTGAVVDYVSGGAPDGASLLLFVAPDRNWGVARFGVLTERSVGTSDDGSRGASRAVVDRYVAAVRARDCASIGKTAYLSDAIRGRGCRGIVASVASLTRRLRADERAEAAYLGGNGTFSFYGVETARPEDENSTVVVMRVAGDRHVVMDVAPSPTAAEVKRITESFKLQQRNSGSMEPSPEEQTGRKAE